MCHHARCVTEQYHLMCDALTPDAWRSNGWSVTLVVTPRLIRPQMTNEEKSSY